MATIDLPDVNVWIAMSAPGHVHRERAEAYWRDEANATIAFNAVTMLGLVRICSNAPIFNGAPIDPGASWRIFQNWTQMDEITYIPEPVECRENLDQLISKELVIKRTWTDAYLAAFAISGGHRLVSFDEDFGAFSDLEFLHLKP